MNVRPICRCQWSQSVLRSITTLVFGVNRLRDYNAWVFNGRTGWLRSRVGSGSDIWDSTPSTCFYWRYSA